jgi:hypothetical protein
MPILAGATIRTTFDASSWRKEDTVTAGFVWTLANINEMSVVCSALLK